MGESAKSGQRVGVTLAISAEWIIKRKLNDPAERDTALKRALGLGRARIECRKVGMIRDEGSCQEKREEA